MSEVRFVVEEAGCPSCAARLREALMPLAVVHSIEIDEAADTASVHLAATGGLGEDVIAGALQEASAGSGHVYRVRSGSWQG